MDKISDTTMNRDVTAAYLSIIPGLGHLYKHHFALGLFYMLVCSPVLGLVTGLLAMPTLGAALIVVPVMWWSWLAYEAYKLEDWAHGHSEDAAKPQPAPRAK